MEETEKYYENNASKLHSVIDSLLYKFKCESYDKQDFYSIGNEVFTNIVTKNSYTEEKGSFDAFLYTALSNKIKSEITRRNRFKRRADKLAISIDTPLNDGFTIGDILSNAPAIEDNTYEKVEKYLNSLTRVQRNIVEMKMDGYSLFEIKQKLNLNEKQYENNWQELKSFEKTQVLFSDTLGDVNREEDKMLNVAEVTTEKSKSKSYSIVSIVKKIDNCTLRFDHPLQREAEQWNPAMKGNLISDILQCNPIPSLVFAEQMIDGMSIIWNLDGKQKCTNAYSFYKGAYKIARNIRRWNIKYQAIKRDNENKPMLNENNIPLSEWKEFDIRGKKYSDLPEELQERFNDYTFEVTQYLNCSSEDISYHIIRYNEGKPMSVPQKGLTRLGEEFASITKSISSMPFFKECGDYKMSEFRNGTINRVVIESVMAANYINDWKKKQEEMCKYIHDNASESAFENLEELINRLSKVMTEDTAEMFDSKDSFLWFGLFERFKKLELSDSYFVQFLSELQSMYSKKINGVSFDDMNGKSTKDKTIVIAKMKHLETLMNDYFTCNSQCA